MPEPSSLLERSPCPRPGRERLSSALLWQTDARCLAPLPAAPVQEREEKRKFLKQQGDKRESQKSVKQLPYVFKTHK